MNLQKTIARIGCLPRPPVGKWKGPIVVWALHRFVTYLFT